MKRIGPWFRHHSLFTVVGVLALAHSAIADDGVRPGRAINAVVTLGEENLELVPPLPLHLDSWFAEMDELNLAEAHAITLELFPQGRMTSKPPFIDTSKWEIGGFAGAVVYSSNFEAKTSYILGLNTRVPVPGLGALGLFGQVFLSYIDRDLPFFYNKQSGTWYGLALGADYTLWRGTLGYVRPQLGVMYANWGGVNSLDNGLGIMVGIQVGLFWIKNNDQTSVTFTPQFQFDGTDHMIFLPIGFSVDF